MYTAIPVPILRTEESRVTRSFKMLYYEEALSNTRALDGIKLKAVCALAHGVSHCIFRAPHLHLLLAKLGVAKRSVNMQAGKHAMRPEIVLKHFSLIGSNEIA